MRTLIYAMSLPILSSVAVWIMLLFIPADFSAAFAFDAHLVPFSGFVTIRYSALCLFASAVANFLSLLHSCLRSPVWMYIGVLA